MRRTRQSSWAMKASGARAWRVRMALLALAAATASALPAPATPVAAATSSGGATSIAEQGDGPPDLRVDGDQIVAGSGRAIQLNGVNRSGTEYACAQGWGIFDGPASGASIAAMARWHIHVVRVPLHEHCWLGINGVSDAYGGPAYRQAIRQYVARLQRHGMNVVLELHISGPGDELAQGQQKMPDADHTPAFWRSVAKRFGADRSVVFDLFNEPHDVSWRCWLHGCSVDGWRAVGMQRLVDVVRAAGANNIIMLGGLGWASDLSRWGSHLPDDPLDQLVASWHVYNFHSCTTGACWSDNVAGVRGKAPVLLGEYGETTCAHGFIDRLMDWADHRGIGYLAWTWDAWPQCDGPTLITDYDGTPTAYGVGVRRHFRAHFSAGDPAGEFKVPAADGLATLRSGLQTGPDTLAGQTGPDTPQEVRP